MVFFDKVHTRPSQRFPVRLAPVSAKLTSTTTRARLVIEGLSADTFSGRFELTIFSGSPLIQAEAVLSTAQDNRAILYDAGLVAPPGRVTSYSWIDPRSDAQSAPADTPAGVRAARYRTAALEFPGGNVTVFPPPHRYLYPLDFADNFGFNWLGRHYDPSAPGDGVGVRQPPTGDNRYVPWVNAPPNTEQRLPVFYRFGPATGVARVCLRQHPRANLTVSAQFAIDEMESLAASAMPAPASATANPIGRAGKTSESPARPAAPGSQTQGVTFEARSHGRGDFADILVSRLRICGCQPLSGRLRSALICS